MDDFEKETGMTANQKDLFKKTCFGQFLDMPLITKSSRIISHLVLRSGYYDEAGASNDSLVMEIGGRPREFTKEHFSLITGLRFSENYAEQPRYANVVEGGLYNVTFCNGALCRKRANIGAVLESSQEWPDERRVRLLLFHFLYNVLLAAEKTVNLPCDSYIKMVDDPVVFNNYPWGDVAWNFFLGSIVGFVSKAKTIKEGKNPKLHLPGFVLPLQIWGYECIPRFVELEFASILVADATPLMRRWATKSGKVLESQLQKIRFQEV